MPPSSARDTEAVDKYLAAWDALASMIASGRSLSGRERNCCFLNTGEAKFSNVSAVSGFDFPDDTRGVTVTDWDHDGDLDIWMTNRTAPRIRFLRNDYDTGQNALLLKLQGVQSNRDAIGSRVEVDLGSSGKLVRALRAGEGYLGQSSKWLHFGLGSASEVSRVVVRWPNGRREVFGGVVASGRYTLIEGSGKAVRTAARKTPSTLVPAVEKEASDPASNIARIVLPARLPMPGLTYRDLEGNDIALVGSPQSPLLINLWATWCQPCLKELAEWAQHHQEFTKSGIRVVLLCVDESTDKGTVDSATIRQLLQRLEIPFSAGFATPDLLEALDVTQQVLTKRVRPLPVPATFLVDEMNRLAVVYKGQTAVEQLLVDVGNLSSPLEEHRDLAVAFPGSWYTNPFPSDLLAIPKKLQELGQPERALRYLKQYAPASMDDTSSSSFYDVTSPKSLASTYVALAESLQAKGKQAEVIESLQAAAELQPSDRKPQLALAMIFQRSGRPADVVSQYRKFLNRNPGDPVIANNLAWLLATCADPSIRKPAEAISLAEAVAKKSRGKLPSALDTLAAAYAAAGRFDDAVSAIDEALAIQRSMGQAGQNAFLDSMSARMQLYKQRKAFIEPTR